MNWFPETSTVVKVLGVVLCTLGLILCWRLSRLKVCGMAGNRMIRLGVVTISAAGAYKLMALVGLGGVPGASVAVA